MPLATLLLPEFQSEMKILRDAIAALPEGQNTFQPHAKSMPLTKLTLHSAQMPVFISAILTGPEGINLAVTKMPHLVFETTVQLLEAYDGMVSQATGVLQGISDASFEEPWKLTAGDREIFSGSRYQAYRVFGMNHTIHHRAQLGVYLRLLNVPVPRVYGPSADFPM